MIKFASVILGTLLFASSSFAYEAIVSCNIDYTSPDGATTVHIVNQNYHIPLAPGVRYINTVLLGDRRLDISAENVDYQGYKSVSIYFWESYGGGRYLCSETNNSDNGAADCSFTSRKSRESANIACTRLY